MDESHLNENHFLEDVLESLETVLSVKRNSVRLVFVVTDVEKTLVIRWPISSNNADSSLKCNK
jgi:hypothetical protein